jgi:hypothetical protein
MVVVAAAKNVRGVLFHGISRNGNDPARDKDPREPFPPFLLVLLARPLTPQPATGRVEVVFMRPVAVVAVV